jgi:hypothetical protein
LLLKANSPEERIEAYLVSPTSSTVISLGATTVCSLEPITDKVLPSVIVIVCDVVFPIVVTLCKFWFPPDIAYEALVEVFAYDDDIAYDAVNWFIIPSDPVIEPITFNEPDIIADPV